MPAYVFRESILFHIFYVKNTLKQIFFKSFCFYSVNFYDWSRFKSLCSYCLYLELGTLTLLGSRITVDRFKIRKLMYYRSCGDILWMPNAKCMMSRDTRTLRTQEHQKYKIFWIHDLHRIKNFIMLTCTHHNIIVEIESRLYKNNDSNSSCHFTFYSLSSGKSSHYQTDQQSLQQQHHHQQQQ